jgi:hypothetical protein
MDFATTLKPDVYRTVTVIILPGLIGACPWLIWFCWPAMNQLSTWHDAGAQYTAVILVVSFSVGLIFEDIASQLEVRCIDPYVIKKKGVTKNEFDDFWKKYLASNFADTMIAHRYLRNILTRFKFELSMLIAILSASIATLLAWVAGIGFGGSKTICLSGLSVILMCYLWSEAKTGACVLYETRRIILKAQ